MKSEGPVDRALLLEELSWIRRLARELVVDRDLAEDLVQETCVVALQRAPGDASKLRRWLSEVLRNLLRQHARSHGRRRAREERVSRPESVGADPLVERALLQREIFDGVLELEEPYRSTVLMRFFDALPPREIARRTGTPLATVNSRLQRALARLRARLDGSQGAWATILLPWARGLEPLGPSTLLPLLMKTQTVLLAAAALLTTGTLVWWSSSPAQRSPEEGPGIATVPEALAQAEPLEPLERPESQRELTPTTVPAPLAERARPDAGEPLVAAWSVRLRVLDAQGAPLAGVAVRAGEEGDGARGGVLGTSGAGGWCSFETREERMALCAADPLWVTVQEGHAERGGSLDPVLVVAPALELGGHVRDLPGRPLAGASLRFQLPEGFTTRFDEVLEASRTMSWRVLSDAEGRFDLLRVPAVPGARLIAVLAGYAHAEVSAPLRSTRELELVLERPQLPLEGVLRGQVLDGAGTRVAGARVGLGVASVVSDEDGRFEITLARAVTSEVLTAVKAGYLPARMARPAEPRPGSSGWPEHVVLVLGGPALHLRGQVVETQGGPVAGARVWLHDPTPAAPIGMMPSFLEPEMGGAKVPPSALESEANLPETDGDNFYDWYTNVHEPSALWNWVLTDEAGRFDLGGLDDRRYRLDVLRPGTLDVVTSPAFAAGSEGVRIELEPPDVFEHFTGRVLGESGEPLEGVEVRLYRPMLDTRARIFGGTSQVVVVENAGLARSDADGRFGFDHVPRKGASLALRAEDVVPASAEIILEQQDVRLEVRCRFEVVLREAPGRLDSIAVTDADGKYLDVLVLTDGSVNAWTSVPLVDGRSGIVSASIRARQLQLRLAGTVVETRAIDLLPGQVNRIEL